ncbi:Uncharacterised protein [Mycobacterium tuberculosis]|nr:Uncharacterised protein [Mycobacterium tuberculosis]
MGGAQDPEHEYPAVGVLQPAACQRRRRGRVEGELEPFAVHVGRRYGELMKRHGCYGELGGGAG